MPRNLKRGGGAQFPVSVENIGKDQKQKKGHRVRRCSVSTVPIAGDIYQLIFQLGGGGGGADPSGYAPKLRISSVNITALELAELR